MVGIITPWNYPLGIAFQSIPWVLACGNTAVLKPSELTPMTGMLLGEVIASAGRPLVEVAVGGGDVGAALVTGDIDAVVFTGSVATGRRIAAMAGERLLPAVLELGGKDAAIVCADADLEMAAKSIVGAAFFNAGQTCLAPERVFVVDAVHDEFVNRVAAHAARLRVGAGDDDRVGPLTVAAQVGVLKDRLDDACSPEVLESRIRAKPVSLRGSR